jgi:endonuclease/exonuclease/phosphatase family metal-dependent hydrolase
MKIVTLNIWGGHELNPLMDFFRRNQDVDVFCLQEVFNGAKVTRPIHQESVMDILPRINAILPNHTAYFSPDQDNEEGIAILVSNSHAVEKSGRGFVYRWENAMVDDNARTLGRSIQHVQLKVDGRRVSVVNVHGLWNGGGKTDTPDRIAQSTNIINFIKGLEGQVILCGDFNLSPETESLRMLEESGLKNLVKEHGITSTRTSFYTKPEKFADYILISPEIDVKKFEVMPDVVSDHSPLFLEI